MDDNTVERVARAIFSVASPHESWDGFDARKEARGGVPHPMQERAMEMARAALAATPVTDSVLAAVEARRAIYVQKRDAADPFADDDSNKRDRMEHTVEAFDLLLAEIKAIRSIG